MIGRVYDLQRWKRVRRVHLSGSPLCLDCQGAGRLTVATVVDHVIPMSEGGPAFPGPDGLRSLCAPCHGEKTARGPEAGAIRTTRARQPRKGCDVNGNPLDAANPWNSEQVIDISLITGRLTTATTLPTQLVPKCDYSEDADG